MCSLIDRIGKVVAVLVLAVVFAGCGGGGGGDAGFSGGGSTTTTSTTSTTSTTTAQPLSITTTSPLPSGTVGQPYLQQLQATGGSSHFQWSIINGTLPPGLQLNSAQGVTSISGTPTTAGAFSFILQVQDTQNSQLTPASQQFSLTINATPTTSLQPLSITTTSPLPSGTVGQDYLALLQATGGSSNFQWSTINGTTLPPGLGFNSASGVTSISGTPTTAGTFSFILQVQDTQNPQLTPATQQFSITINPGSGTATVKDIQLLVSSPQLPSASNNQVSCSNNNSVTLTALVRDNSNNVLSGIPVGFNADNDGTILPTRGTTDTTGTAQAQLCTPDNSDNRTINVTASAGGKNANATVQVTGTTIRISGPTSVISGSSINLALTLTDSSGAGIANKTLNISSALNNPISNPAPLTDFNGGAKVTITAANTGSDTITVTGAGANAVQLLNISADQFAFVTPVNCSPSPVAGEIYLNTPCTVTVQWLKLGTAQVGKTVNFSTTRGTITATGQTDVNGQVTATLQADSAGPAIITASVNNGPSTQVEVLFVATQANTLTLQADPATLAPNQPSIIKATVFDSNKNRVKGQTIIFTLSDPTGGSISAGTAVTNAYGEASISYTAGSVASAKNGVKVTAAVTGTALQETASLTVTQQLFIVLGTGNLIQKPDSTRYEKPYSVLVTDAVGGPAPNVKVTLNIVPTDYSKGFYTFPANASAWVQTVTATCSNEDFFFGVNDLRSGNGILDLGEDQNGNGRLDPGNVVTLSALQVTTDNEGFGYFNLVYAQQFANWVDVELTAQATVAGSEAINVARFNLPILASDLTDKNVSPPGNPSPFGRSNACTDTK